MVEEEPNPYMDFAESELSIDVVVIEGETELEDDEAMEVDAQNTPPQDAVLKNDRILLKEERRVSHSPPGTCRRPSTEEPTPQTPAITHLRTSSEGHKQKIPAKTSSMLGAGSQDSSLTTDCSEKAAESGTNINNRRRFTYGTPQTYTYAFVQTDASAICELDGKLYRVVIQSVNRSKETCQVEYTVWRRFLEDDVHFSRLHRLSPKFMKLAEDTEKEMGVVSEEEGGDRAVPEGAGEPNNAVTARARSGTHVQNDNHVNRFEFIEPGARAMGQWGGNWYEVKILSKNDQRRTARIEYQGWSSHENVPFARLHSGSERLFNLAQKFRDEWTKEGVMPSWKINVETEEEASEPKRAVTARARSATRTQHYVREVGEPHAVTTRARSGTRAQHYVREVGEPHAVTTRARSGTRVQSNITEVGEPRAVTTRSRSGTRVQSNITEVGEPHAVTTRSRSGTRVQSNITEVGEPHPVTTRARSGTRVQSNITEIGEPHAVTTRARSGTRAQHYVREVGEPRAVTTRSRSGTRVQSNITDVGEPNNAVTARARSGTQAQHYVREVGEPRAVTTRSRSGTRVQSNITEVGEPRAVTTRSRSGTRVQSNITEVGEPKNSVTARARSGTRAQHYVREVGEPRAVTTRSRSGTRVQSNITEVGEPGAVTSRSRSGTRVQSNITEVGEPNNAVTSRARSGTRAQTNLTEVGEPNNSVTARARSGTRAQHYVREVGEPNNAVTARARSGTHVQNDKNRFEFIKPGARAMGQWGGNWYEVKILSKNAQRRTARIDYQGWTWRENVPFARLHSGSERLFDLAKEFRDEWDNKGVKPTWTINVDTEEAIGREDPTRQ